MIEPLDVDRCQAEVPNGNTFMTLGGVVGRERCKERPAYVLVERKPGKGGEYGAMTVCTACFAKFVQQVGLSVAHAFVIKGRDGK